MGVFDSTLSSDDSNNSNGLLFAIFRWYCISNGSFFGEGTAECILSSRLAEYGFETLLFEVILMIH